MKKDDGEVCQYHDKLTRKITIVQWLLIFDIGHNFIVNDISEFLIPAFLKLVEMCSSMIVYCDIF